MQFKRERESHSGERVCGGIRMESWDVENSRAERERVRRRERKLMEIKNENGGCQEREGKVARKIKNVKGLRE